MSLTRRPPLTGLSAKHTFFLPCPLSVAVPIPWTPRRDGVEPELWRLQSDKVAEVGFGLSSTSACLLETVGCSCRSRLPFRVVGPCVCGELHDKSSLLLLLQSVSAGSSVPPSFALFALFPSR